VNVIFDKPAAWWRCWAYFPRWRAKHVILLFVGNAGTRFVAFSCKREIVAALATLCIKPAIKRNEITGLSESVKSNTSLISTSEQKIIPVHYQQIDLWLKAMRKYLIWQWPFADTRYATCISPACMYWLVIMFRTCTWQCRAAVRKSLRQLLPNAWRLRKWCMPCCLTKIPKMSSCSFDLFAVNACLFNRNRNIIFFPVLPCRPTEHRHFEFSHNDLQILAWEQKYQNCMHFSEQTRRFVCHFVDILIFFFFWSRPIFYLFSLKLVSNVAIGKPERHVRKASHCGSKQQ